MEIPQDSMILLSFINTKLRDFYKDLDELCEDLNVEKSELTEKLDAIDCKYDEKLNRFV